ncbi:MAG TPA: SH3 domain-containing protein [Anaerolineae bacterium]|nr:SH3 domain-containing protein [Anaerolineae bacterium]
MKHFMVSVAFVLLMITGFAAPATFAQTGTPTATPGATDVWVIASAGLSLRSQSNITAQRIAVLPFGQHLTTTGPQVGPDSAGIVWQPVRTDAGQTGWVAAVQQGTPWLSTTKPAAATPVPTATPAPAAGLPTQAAATGEAWVSNGAGLNLRAQSNITATVITLVPFGGHLTTTGPQVGPDSAGIVWRPVRTDAGRTGWVAASLKGAPLLSTTKPGAATAAPTAVPTPAVSTPAPAAATGDVWVTATTRLNLRAQASTTASLITTLSLGQHLTAVGLPSGPDAAGITWQNVRTDGGQTGWVSAQYLSRTAPAAAATPGATAPSGTPAPSDAVGELFNRINTLRAQNGLPPYVLNADLSRLAQTHSQYMADSGNITHRGADGATARQRIVGAGYGAGYSTENIYAGASLNDAWTFWVDDPPHRDNLLNPVNTVIGIGIATRGTMTYYTTDFGVPDP